MTIKRIDELSVTGDRAYVVTTARYDWKEKGKPMTEEASKWTFALRKVGKSWLIASWTWSQQP